MPLTYHLRTAHKASPAALIAGCALVLAARPSTAIDPAVHQQAMTASAATVASAAAKDPWQAEPQLSQFGAGPGPQIIDGALHLLHGNQSQCNVVTFKPAAEGPHWAIDGRFRLRVEKGADGCGFAILNTAEYDIGGPGPNISKWEEPNLRRSFAVGFDIYNPPTDHRFDANGNIYGRPQREVSLHWDGTEVANTLSPIEFRDGQFHDVSIGIRFQIGGADVTVTIDGTDIYRDRFIPQMRPYEGRVAIGARSGDMTTSLAIDDLSVSFTRPVTDYPQPVTLRPFDGVIIHAGNRAPTAQVSLADPNMDVARIIMTLKLGPAPGGFDPWDRGAAVYVWGDDGQRYEIARYITPYDRGYMWKIDVTDYQSLLCGDKKMGLKIDTWMKQAEDPKNQKGWSVTVKLDYYPGTRLLQPFSVTNLWSGHWEYGNPDAPLADRFTPRTIRIPPDTEGAKLRVMVTGHGQRPATNNAAEFMPAKRTLIVNDERFENVLWKTDCYLNPCRPQGGTWKFDRAGWAPGSVVEPWELDITDCVTPGKTAAFEYIPQQYVNENREEARASHWVECQLILYR